MRIVIINGAQSHTERLTSACTALLQGIAPQGIAPQGIAIVNLGLIRGYVDSSDAAGTDDTPLALVVEAHEQVSDAFRLLDLVRGLPEFARFVRLLAVESRALEHLPTIGAFDDFMLAPYTSIELRQRVHAAWSRRRYERIASGETYRLTPELTVDAIGHHVTLGSTSIELTAKEHALLVCFCRSLGRVQSRAELIARVWGSGYTGSLRTIDIHVRRLRLKLGDALPLYTIRGSGYWLKVANTAEPVLTELEPPASHTSSVGKTAAA